MSIGCIEFMDIPPDPGSGDPPGQPLEEDSGYNEDSAEPFPKRSSSEMGLVCHWTLPGVLTMKIMSFLGVPDLCRQSLISKELAALAHSDVVWKGVAQRSRQSYLRFIQPELISAVPISPKDIQIVLVCLISVADVVTDLWMIADFAAHSQWLFFGLSVPWLFISPLVMTLMEHVSGAPVTPLGVLFSFLHLRSVLEAAFFFHSRGESSAMEGQAKLGAAQQRVDILWNQQKQRKDNIGVAQMFSAVFSSVPQAFLQSYLLIGVARDTAVGVAATSVTLSLAAVGLAILVLSEDQQKFKFCGRCADQIPVEWKRCNMCGYDQPSRDSLRAAPFILFAFTSGGLAYRLAVYALFFVVAPSAGIMVIPLIATLLFNWGFVALFGMNQRAIGLAMFAAFVASIVPVSMKPSESARFKVSSQVFAVMLFAASQIPLASAMCYVLEHAWRVGAKEGELHVDGWDGPFFYHFILLISLGAIHYIAAGLMLGFNLQVLNS